MVVASTLHVGISPSDKITYMYVLYVPGWYVASIGLIDVIADGFEGSHFNLELSKRHRDFIIPHPHKHGFRHQNLVSIYPRN